MIQKTLNIEMINNNKKLGNNKTKKHLKTQLIDNNIKSGKYFEIHKLQSNLKIHNNKILNKIK